MERLREAVLLLDTAAGVSVTRVSGVYETEPVGVRDQSWFLNAVVEVSTDLSPAELLRAAKVVEASVGRTPTYRWGPREIDVDILLYGEEWVGTGDLAIPHPRMGERLFVLLPLRELLPEWTDGEGVAIDRLIDRLQGGAEVRPLAECIR
jgi:2-amino-4-hydroxy-6-hydroxymethyldihydropteridine diphosphokinase